MFGETVYKIVSKLVNTYCMIIEGIDAQEWCEVQGSSLNSKLNERLYEAYKLKKGKQTKEKIRSYNDLMFEISFIRNFLRRAQE